MITKFNSQNVEDAVFAHRYNRIAKASGGTPEEWIENDCMDGESLSDDLEMYKRGSQLLFVAKVMTTNDRYDETNSTAYNLAAQKLRERGAESPVVEFPNGYAGTSQMCVVYALKSV